MANLDKLVHQWMFRQMHSNQLIYNCTWEDPRIDRKLLNLDSTSSVVAITSAGCNILDMALDKPSVIHAIDLNPRQNYLLEFKQALIKYRPYEDLFLFFGIGSHVDRDKIFKDISHALRPQARHYWQHNLRMFDPRGGRSSFYWHGTTGMLAWTLWLAAAFLPINLKGLATTMFASQNREEQIRIFELAEPYIWRHWMESYVTSSFAMSLIAVPPSQIDLIRRTYQGGLFQYIQDKFKYVWTEVPVADNYFWRVYTYGSYTHNCCPNYLKPENHRLLSDYNDFIRCHDQSIADFLSKNPGNYTHYVLLDHLDWLSYYDVKELNREWELILANSMPGTKILFRSAGDGTGLIPERIKSRLRQSKVPLQSLHKLDRVGTYGSLHLWEVA